MSNLDEAEFAQLLASHRLALGMTQEELACRSGMSVRAICDMERGRARGPQQRSVEALADALRLDDEARSRLLAAARSGRARAARTGSAGPTLPVDLPCFTGRRDAVDLVRRHAEPTAAESRRAAAIVCVAGTPGVGKTAFAVHTAREIAPCFPDGQFFVDLWGMDPRPHAPAEVLAHLLRSLGTADQAIPPAVDERAALFRSLLYQRRVLLVLDNAADEAQVRPLLPSEPGCLVLITSRRNLIGLDNATRLTLDVLDRELSLEILESALGTARVAAEPTWAAEVAGLCGDLPLALRIVADRMSSRPTWTFEGMAGQLDDERGRLPSLGADDLRMRGAFEVSYRQLGTETATLFRRLALAPGKRFGAPLAARLVDTDQVSAELILEELADASLLAEDSDRAWRMHDLLRLFAREKLDEDDPATVEAAGRRVDDWLIWTAVDAGRLINPDADKDGLPIGGQQETFTDRASAVAWLDEQVGNCLVAADHAASAGRHRDVVALARAMHWYSDARPFSYRWDELFGGAANSARALADRTEEATQLNFLGWTLYYCVRRFTEAAEVLERAALIAHEVGDPVQEAWALAYLGTTFMLDDRAEAGVPRLERAVELFHAAGYALGERIARMRLARNLMAAGRFEPAAELLRQVVDAGRGPADSHDSVNGWALQALGDCLGRMHRWHDAADTFAEAALVCESWQYREPVSLSRLGQGKALRAGNDLTGARDCLREAADIAGEIGARATQATALRELASTVAKLGDAKGANEIGEAAEVIQRQLDHRPE